MRRSAPLAALLAAAAAGCAREPPAPAPPPRPALLLVTLDTTRADAVAPEADAAVTPHLAALAARGITFAHAYSTAPTTLPAHASMMTGLYPAGHGVHENGRRLDDGVPLVAERLRELGYATAALVSGYPLERQYGLARGFDRYDDEMPVRGVERSAEATTERALAHLESLSGRAHFLWVHYFDPHDPYEPPEPFRSRFAADPYRGEIAAMDHQLGRLLAAFEAACGERPWRLVVAADHGEGRGDHGEMLHGNLLYQGVMRVPLVVAGSGLAPGRREDAVSLRQIRATLLDWAGDRSEGSLLAAHAEPVLGEAMQPFLNYRWQPQVMAVDGRQKLIRSGRLELYDLLADPAERRDLADEIAPPRELARAVADYPLPATRPAGGGQPLDEEARRRLASLGYLGDGETPRRVPPDAPRAADMTHLFDDLDLVSRRFSEEDYERVLPPLGRVLAADPGNLMATVRLAVSHALLGDDARALAAFAAARRIDPDSIEVRHYLGLHHARRGRAEEAAPLLEEVLAVQPDRFPALVALAEIRARRGRLAEAASLLERALPLAREPAPLAVELGQLRMGLGETGAALAAFERARGLQGPSFGHDLELGVLYLAARRPEEARAALDRVPATHPGHAMALFKRAQVSVLLGEPDRAERVRAAWAAADPETRPLIQNERLFTGLLPP